MIIRISYGLVLVSASAVIALLSGDNLWQFGPIKFIAWGLLLSGFGIILREFYIEIRK